MAPRDKLPKTWDAERQTVNYWSPSSITRSDPSQYGGCFRRGRYVTIEGRKEPFTKAKAKGVDGHTQIDNYYQTGVRALDRSIMAGFEHLPEPSEYIVSECRIHRVDDPLEGGVQKVFNGESGLYLDGIPVVGYMDLEDLRHTRSPKIYDWKFTGNLLYANHDLIRTVQMSLYGKYVADKVAAQEIGLYHVYFKKRTPYRAEKTGRIYSIDEINSEVDRIRSACREILDVFREPDFNKVPGNSDACDAWEGCPHATYCDRGSKKSLAEFLGIDSAELLVQKIEGKPTEEKVMANIDDFLGAEVDDELAKLEQEDKAASKVNIPAGFMDAWRSIEYTGKGLPTLAGMALECYLAATGESLPEGENRLKGSGIFLEKGLVITDPQHILKLSEKVLAKYAAKKDAAPPAILPPDAPDNATGSAKPEEPAQEAKPQVKVTEVKVTEEAKVEESRVEESNTSSLCLTPAEFNKLNKPQMKEEYELLYNMKTNDSVGDVAYTISASVKPADGLHLYVDCIPYSGEGAEPLNPWVQEVAAKVAKHFGVADIRCGGKDAIDFGKWKGLLAAAIKEVAPKEGTYYLSTRGDEFGEIAARALIEVADVYVGGV